MLKTYLLDLSCAGQNHWGHPSATRGLFPSKLLGGETEQEQVHVCGHGFPARGTFMLSKHTNLGKELIVLSCLVPESCEASGFKCSF